MLVFLQYLTIIELSGFVPGGLGHFLKLILNL